MTELAFDTAITHTQLPLVMVHCYKDFGHLYLATPESALSLSSHYVCKCLS